MASWAGTDHAGFSLSVSRDLQIAIGRSGNGGYRLHSNTLDVTDVLEVGVDVFGNRSAGDLRQSYPAEGAEGTIRYTGGLLGAAIDRTGLPPVTGDASLAVKLGSLDGTASFTSLQVHTYGNPETFFGGSLHYPFELSANAIVGTEAGSTLQADFYGPGHESVAGALHDPNAGLLASFGASHDDRPGREDVIAAADRLLGGSYRSDAADPAADGWTQYRCATATACESRRAGSDGWGDLDDNDPLRGACRDSRLDVAKRRETRCRPRRGAHRTAFGGVHGRPPGSSCRGRLHGNAGARRVRDRFREAYESGRCSRRGHRGDGLLLRQVGRRPGNGVWYPARGGGEMVRRDAGLPGRTLCKRDPVRGRPREPRVRPVRQQPGRGVLGRRQPGRTAEAPQLCLRGPASGGDGTFGSDGAAGALDGAFFGPFQEEAAGAFHHNTSDVTGSFGARRLPDIAALEESGPSASQPPIVEDDANRYVGADAAPALHELTTAGDYGSVAVSSGQVQDGAGADRVLAYLRRHIDDDYNNWVPGLATFPDPPVVRVARGTSEELAAYTETAVQLINSALPRENHIVFSRNPAPRSTAIENVPEGEIFVNFAGKQDWNLREGQYYGPDWLRAVEADSIQEYNQSARRHENKSMRAAHLWFDSQIISNAAWVRNPDTDIWEWQVLDAPALDSDTTIKYYVGERVISQIVWVMLQVLGFYGYVDETEFPDSILTNNSGHLPNIDGEALLAAYTRLEPGTLPEDLSAGSLGPWEDTSFHLRGDLEFAGGEAAFGVALRNGLARPWASGPAPLAALENNSALYGTVSWNGALLGVTPSAETVAGQARLAVELATLDGRLDFTGLERWGVKTPPGTAGTGTAWGDGDLGYSVEVQGNAFHRTGGDDGEVAGAFFGAAHEAMGGVLERSDLTAGFGGTR